MMQGSRAALRYAKALIEYAKEEKVLDSIQQDILLIRDTLIGNKELQLVLRNPIIKLSQKKKVIEEVFPKLKPQTLDLISLLVSNKRMELLEFICEKFLVQYEILKGKETAVVTTAIPLTDELKDKVLEQLGKMTEAKVKLENKIDPKILGGFILRIEDKQYDASLASQLKEIKRVFITS